MLPLIHRSMEIWHINRADRLPGFLTPISMPTISHDHVSLPKRAGPCSCCQRGSRACFPFTAIHDGETLATASLHLTALRTPGHTMESACYILEGQVLLTGDTLFLSSIGRPDLEAKQYSERMHSMRACTGFLSLPADTLILRRADFVRSVLARLPASPPNAEQIVRLNEQGVLPEHSFTGGPVAVRSPKTFSRTKSLQLGLRAHWRQCSLLVLITAFVGSMVGLERTILPLLAEHDFGIASRTAILSFPVSSGLVKAGVNLFAGRLGDRIGRKRIFVLGWLIGLPVPLLIIVAPSWGWVVFANVFLGINQGWCWSSTVIMKIDLIGPKQRGLAMGLNEAAGDLATTYALRPQPFLLGVLFASPGLILSWLGVRESREYALLEATRAQAGVPDVPSEPSQFWGSDRANLVEESHLVRRVPGRIGE
jgi:hypothetical protein